MTEKQNSPFSASSSYIGYLYQGRYALLESIRKIKNDFDFNVSIERLDDISFEQTGEPIELLQTKHHIGKKGSLTDTSVDVWKTLRIWCEEFSNQDNDHGSLYFLITTGKAPDGSASCYLSSDVKKRNVEKALERLNATADSSTNKENKAGYEAFRSLPFEKRKKLLNSIIVMDSAPSITDLDSELKKEMFYVAPQKFLDSFLKRLEGWWLKKVIYHLSDNNLKPIKVSEIHDEISRLREQFKQNSLPIDDDIAGRTIDGSGYQDRTFIHQLQEIEIGQNRIVIAIRNFIRASEQRSRWVREDLLLVNELQRYEKKLREEWEIRFSQMRDALGPESDDEDISKKAQGVYKWVETDPLLPIRRECTEPFVARGTYQIMADRLQIGWHPDYEKIFKIQEISK